MFNRNIKKITKIAIKSDYTENKAKDLDKNANSNEQLDYFFHSLFFHGIQYDSYRDQYYRLHINKSDDPSVFNNREAYLTIINSNFEKVDEIALPTNLYPIFNITPQGLLFQFMQGLHEDQYSYMILTSSLITPIEVNDSIVSIKPDTIKATALTKTLISTKDKSDIQDKIAMQDIRDYLTKKRFIPKPNLRTK